MAYPARPIPTQTSRSHPLWSFVTLVGGVQLLGLLGAAFPPGSWYTRLAKPAWTPPNEVFAPVWIALYLLIGLSLWLVWRQEPIGPGQTRQRRTALTWQGIHLLLNALWTPLFFGLHLVVPALIDLSLLWLAIVAGLVFTTRVHRLAGLLLLPYLAWISLAWSLNAGIWWLNR